MAKNKKHIFLSGRRIPLITISVFLITWIFVFSICESMASRSLESIANTTEWFLNQSDNYLISLDSSLKKQVILVETPYFHNIEITFEKPSAEDWLNRVIFIGNVADRQYYLTASFNYQAALGISFLYSLVMIAVTFAFYLVYSLNQAQDNETKEKSDIPNPVVTRVIDEVFLRFLVNAKSRTTQLDREIENYQRIARLKFQKIGLDKHEYIFFESIMTQIAQIKRNSEKLSDSLNMISGLQQKSDPFVDINPITAPLYFKSISSNFFADNAINYTINIDKDFRSDDNIPIPFPSVLRLSMALIMYEITDNPKKIHISIEKGESEYHLKLKSSFAHKQSENLFQEKHLRPLIDEQVKLSLIKDNSEAEITLHWSA